VLLCCADVLEYNKEKKQNSKNRLGLSPPTQQEAAIIHNMYLEQRQYSMSSKVGI